MHKLSTAVCKAQETLDWNKQYNYSSNTTFANDRVMPGLILRVTTTKGWKDGSIDRMLTLQTQGTKFKCQIHVKNAV